MIYTLMHKKTSVADIEIDTDDGQILKICNIHSIGHIPIGVATENGKVNRSDLNKWWIGRSIPASRSGIKEALEILSVYSTTILLERCFGLGLSDQYWINNPRKPLDWDEINFFENSFSEDVGNALFGKVPKITINLISPDNTSDGWLKKRWIIADGKRTLLKGGSGPAYQEPLNEVLASLIMRKLNIPHIEYTLTEIDELPMSICEDFITPDTELVSAWNILLTDRKRKNNVSLYHHFLNCCETLGIPSMKEAIDKMLILDFLIANVDRHFHNFGAIRDANTLEWIGASPIFDCGTSMWHDQYTQNIHPGFKIESKPFRSYHSTQIKLVDNFSWIDFSALEDIDEEFCEIYKISKYIDENRQRVLLSSLNGDSARG